MKTLLNSIKLAVIVACTFLSTQSFAQWTEVALPSQSPNNEFVVIGDNYFTYQYMGGGIYKSTDKGHNWTRSMKGLRPKLGIRDLISFQDRLFVSTYGEGVHLSSDLGESWEVVHALPEGAYDNFTMHNGELVTVSQNGRIFMSSNAGTRWTEVKRPEAWSYNGENRRVFSNGRDLLFAIGEGRLYKSANNGASWTGVNFGKSFHSPGYFFHIATNDNAIWVAATDKDNAQILLHSSDYGQSWNVLDVDGRGNHVLSVAVTDSFVAYTPNGSMTRPEKC